MRHVATLLLFPLLATPAAADLLRAGRQLTVSLPTESVDAAAVAGASTGAFAVAWPDWDGTQTDVLGRFYDAGNQPSAAPAAVHVDGSGVQTQSDVAVLPGGAYVVTWVSFVGPPRIFARRFDAAGAPLGAEFPVLPTADDQREPRVAARSDGRFVVVWRGCAGLSGLCGKVFDASGAALTTDFPLGTAASAVVTATGAGDFVVVMTRDGDADGDGDGVFAQRFDQTGTLLGPQLQVNTTTDGFQEAAGVAGDAAGGFVATWTDGAGHDGDAAGVFAQRFDASNAPIGGEFQVNATSQGRQLGGSVAIDATGEVLIVWSSSVKGNAFDVVGRRYDATWTPIGGEFQVNEKVKGIEGGARVTAAGPRGFVVAWVLQLFFNKVPGVFAQRLAPDAPVAGGKLLFIVAADPTKSRLTWTAGDAAVSTTPGISMTPTADGAWLHVFNADGSGESACIPLPASHWTAAGNPSAPTYNYKDASFTQGPCSSVQVKAGKLKATCKGTLQPIAYTLDEPAQGSMAVSLRSGDTQYCTLFGGVVTQDSGALRLFSAKNAPPPAGCPTPPVSCP